MQNSCICHTYFIHIPYISNIKSNAKTHPKNIKHKVTHTQKYLPNQSKIGPKSLPGTLLGALLQEVVFFLTIFVPTETTWEPRGSSTIKKNTKTRKKKVLKKHLKSVPQKTSKICDSGTPQNLPDRAETRARASFSLIHPITKKSSKSTKKAPILEPLGRPKSQKMRKSDLQKNT